jgi:signal transduction histidine kinase
LTQRLGAIPFQTKLLAALLAVGVIPVVLVCTLLSGLHFFQARQMAMESLRSQIRVVAIHSQAALSFDDPEAGRETLAALAAQPSIRWAAIYRRSGDLFAVYRVNQEPLPPQQMAGIHRGDDGMLLHEPVHLNDQNLGVVLASYSLTEVYSQLRRDVGLSLLAGAVAAGLAVVLSFHLRRFLVAPLRELVDTAHRVTQTADYSARAAKHTQDEFGDLTDTFNLMLQRIEAQDDQLQHRHDEMQQFLYTVSHDLKSPLVTISGFVGLMREDLAQQQYEELKNSMEHLGRASQHMGQLIDDLLELSRIGRVRAQPEPIAVDALVRDLVADLRPQIERFGPAHIEVEPDLPGVIADRVRLTQVFSNLIINALKYGLGERAVIEIGARRMPGETRFFVRDHGRGIGPEYRQRVFVLFQRLQKQGEGTGVGLTIVSRILQSHGGRVWLEETPGGGATFWFALPDQPPSHDHPATKDSP